MAQLEIPKLTASRIRTRTYDTPEQNAQQVIDAIVSLLVPAGTIIPTLLDVEPEGDAWKLCNGQWLSKTEFSRLYAAFSGKVEEDETRFRVPNMSNRTVMGLGLGVSIGDFIGQSQVALTISNIPAHSHGVTDPGHTHQFIGTPHTHTVNDPGHAHSVTDPGHSHTTHQASSSADVATGEDETSASTGGTTGSATTGVSVNNATTGISIEQATAGGENSNSTTGISIVKTGEGKPVDITPPALVVNWMVRT